MRNRRGAPSEPPVPPGAGSRAATPPPGCFSIEASCLSKRVVRKELRASRGPARCGVIMGFSGVEQRHEMGGERDILPKAQSALGLLGVLAPAPDLIALVELGTHEGRLRI